MTTTSPRGGGQRKPDRLPPPLHPLVRYGARLGHNSVRMDASRGHQEVQLTATVERRSFTMLLDRATVEALRDILTDHLERNS